jgi:CHASE3 domain sensor protein
MTQSPPAINLDPAIEKKLLAGILVALVIVAAMTAAAIQNNARQAESSGWVNHSHAFILEADAILSSLNAAEAVQRTYILSGDMATMQAASDRFAKVAEHLGIAQQLAFESPTQLQRLDRVAALLQRQIDWNKQSVQLRARSTAAAAGVFTNAVTRANLADIEKEINTAKSEENNLLLQREQKLQRHTRRTEQILYTGMAVNVVLLALAFYVVRRDLILRRRASTGAPPPHCKPPTNLSKKRSMRAPLNSPPPTTNFRSKTSSKSGDKPRSNVSSAITSLFSIQFAKPSW